MSKIDQLPFLKVFNSTNLYPDAEVDKRWLKVKRAQGTTKGGPEKKRATKRGNGQTPKKGSDESPYK